MKVQVVLGLGYGDEGKGLTTSYLASKAKNPLVVRFNGGHQAGHTVVKDGVRHVFASYGSGTLHGADTFITDDCVIHPSHICNEYAVLRPKYTGDIKLNVAAHAMVCTPWDIKLNQYNEKREKNGSVGVGFGHTIQREENHYHLLVQDLLFPKVFEAKLEAIKKRYGEYYGVKVFKKDEKLFRDHCRQVLSLINVGLDNMDFTQYDTVIFEGAQGILLDQTFGFFPHVTRSNTTSKNTRWLREALTQIPEIYYVTRSYATRHGNGPFEEAPLELKNNEDETNVEDRWQGKLRVGHLDPELIRYALVCDKPYAGVTSMMNLVITCMDQHTIDVNDLVSNIGFRFDEVFVSTGPEAKDVKKL